MSNERSTSDRRAAANLLQAVLDGRTSPSEALQQWPVASSDELVERTRCLLYHFRDDADIRARDEKYAEWQYNQFRTLLGELKAT